MANIHVGIHWIGGREWMGGRLYVENLIRNLEDLDQGERPQITIMKYKNKIDNAELAKSYSTLSYLESLKVNAAKAVKRFLGWNMALNTEQDMVFPALSVDEPFEKVIYWIPDFQHRFLPDNFSPEERAKRDSVFQKISEQDGLLCLSSKTALSHFKEFYPKAKITPFVWNFRTRLNIDNILPQKPKALPDKYIYIPNQFWKHKDHVTAFKAVAQLKEKGIEIPLVCTGRENDDRNADYILYLNGLKKELGIEEQIYSLGLVPREEQINIFRYAAAVLQPSQFEGWGTVLEDTQLMGQAMIVSDLDVHKEQVPNAVFFKTGKPGDLCKVLEKQWHNLEAGYNKDKEMRAVEAYTQLQLNSGKDFMQMIKQAITA